MVNIGDYSPTTDPAIGQGNFEDLIVSLSEGRVTYVLLALDELGVGGELIAVPLGVFDPTVANNVLNFNSDFDASLLEEAPRFDTDTFGDSGLFEEGYDEEWQGFWGDASYSMEIGEEIGE